MMADEGDDDAMWEDDDGEEEGYDDEDDEQDDDEDEIFRELQLQQAVWVLFFPLSSGESPLPSFSSSSSSSFVETLTDTKIVVLHNIVAPMLRSESQMSVTSAALTN
jgi:hypothetical protein